MTMPNPFAARRIRILVAIDFSPASARALEVARRWQERFSAEQHLVHVVPAPTGSPVTGGVATELDDLRRLGAAGECHLVAGEPVAQILALAGRLATDLIVMGSHGNTGVERLLMGSVAEAVVRRAPCPVLCVKRWQRLPHLTEKQWPVVLCPVDFSILAHGAMKLAAGLAARIGGELLLFHASEGTDVFVEGMRIDGARSGALVAEGRATLAAWADEARRLGARQVSTAAVDDVPDRAILAAADGCDLVVMATHGRSGLGHLVFGSVAEQVVRRATRPVLVVSPEVARTAHFRQADDELRAAVLA
jgi:nucleotide-binding universal stress UspA family protein